MYSSGSLEQEGMVGLRGGICDTVGNMIRLLLPPNTQVVTCLVVAL